VVILSQSYAPSQPLPPNVTFMSHRVPLAKLQDLISRAAVVVIPIKSHFVAAGQNAMLEVMCLSRPLVVTSNLTTLEHATHGRDALFHSPRDPQDLARAVRNLLDDPEMAAAMSRQARKRAVALPEEQETIFLEELDRILHTPVCSGDSAGQGKLGPVHG
jgi:glycosyltransferase involved in cell wall biosynthesis